MAIDGIILFSVGSAIAKYIVKSWLGNDLLDELAEELIDLVKDEGVQTAEQRRVQNDGEKLAAAMTSRMRQVYDNSKLPNNAKQAVAAEVAITLNKTKLSVEHVVAYAMDAEKLARILLERRPDATRLFSADETTLYERLISEAAFAQVQISGLLESFTGVFATKVLQDNKRLLFMVEKLLREPDQKSKQFLMRYKETVKRKLDQLEVFGLPKLDTYSSQLSLSVAYISLDAEHRDLDSKLVKALYARYEETIPSIKIDQDALSTLSVKLIRNKLLHDVGSQFWLSIYKDLNDSTETDRFQRLFNFSLERIIAQRPNSIESVLAGKRRIVIQGQAGSGKTTLLQWLAVRAASGDFDGQLSNWNQSIPFFIRLREFVDKGFPTPQNFIEKIAPMIVEDMPENWVHDVLDSGLGLVLVDGVDELPLDRRETMLERLADLVATYPASRYVVSSRPAALKEQVWPKWKEWVETEGFFTTALRDMDSVLVTTFIEQWHTALAASVNDVEKQRKIESYATSLKSLLNGRPPLRRLAKNPLLCAMICALYQERLQNLPNERLKLYEECVEMLLTRRDEGRRVLSNYDYPIITLAQRLALLQDLSYWMIRNGYSDLEIGKADQRFERLLPSLNLTNSTGEKVRRLFVDRTNLLREPVLQSVDFTHLTFQEYLAAREVVEQGDFGLLTKNAHNDTWRELIVLALGIARQKEREKTLRDIITRSHQITTSRSKRKQLALLALACLETSTLLDPKLRDEIIQNAAVAIPPSDDDEIKLVAAAGDPAIQLLTPNGTYTEEQAVFCIKTLALIGSEKAMIQLAAFAKDARNPIYDALVTAWDNFDRDQYAQTVLTSLDQLTINPSNHLRGVKHLSNVVSLTILKRSLDNEELQELSTLPNLEKLTIRLQKISDALYISPIKSLRKLNIRSANVAMELPDIRLSLSVYRGDFPDLESLQLLTNLRKLTISTYKTELDIRRIASIIGLTALHINSRIVPNSFESLVKLSQLSELTISIPFNPADLKAIAALSKLTDLVLELGSSPNSAELVPLENLHSLKIISRESLNLDSISALGQLAKLDLSQCEMNDISPIVKLKKLTHLKLPYKYNSELSTFNDNKGLKIETSKIPINEIFNEYTLHEDHLEDKIRDLWEEK